MRKRFFGVMLLVLFAVCASAETNQPRSGGCAPGLSCNLEMPSLSATATKTRWWKKAIKSPAKLAKLWLRNKPAVLQTAIPEPKQADAAVKAAYQQVQQPDASGQAAKGVSIHDALESMRQTNRLFVPTRVDGLGEAGQDLLSQAGDTGTIGGTFAVPPQGTSAFVETRLPTPSTEIVINGSYDGDVVKEVRIPDEDIPSASANISFMAYPPELEKQLAEIRTRLAKCNERLVFENIVLLLADPAGAIKMLQTAKETYAAKVMTNITNPANLLGSLFTDSCKTATVQDLRRAQPGQMFVLHAALVEEPKLAAKFLAEEALVYGESQQVIPKESRTVHVLPLPNDQSTVIPVAVEVPMGRSGDSKGQPAGVATVIEAALVEPNTKKGKAEEKNYHPPAENAGRMYTILLVMVVALGVGAIKAPTFFHTLSSIFLSLFRPFH
jgi:hypothetical protein